MSEKESVSVSMAGVGRLACSVIFRLTTPKLKHPAPKPKPKPKPKATSQPRRRRGPRAPGDATPEKPWGLITWSANSSIMRAPTFWASRAEAEANAPAGEPHTICNVYAKSDTRRRSEILSSNPRPTYPSSRVNHDPRTLGGNYQRPPESTHSTSLTDE